MSDAIVVFMTSANADEARRIAHELVERQLAACVQILPEIESVYRWNGEVQRETELLLLAKTTAAQFDDLERAVREIHSYDTPEIRRRPDGPRLRTVSRLAGRQRRRLTLVRMPAAGSARLRCAYLRHLFERAFAVRNDLHNLFR